MAAAVKYVEIPEPEYGLHRLTHLGDAVLQVLVPDEVKVLREEPCWQMETGRRSAKTFVKYPDLRVVLVTMKPKTRTRRHRTNARLAVFGLSGHIRVHLPHAIVELLAGELVALDRNLPHDVETIRQSTFLMINSSPGSAPPKKLPKITFRMRITRAIFGRKC
jgi:quercetin dioxygenase-like cupin family protein